MPFFSWSYNISKRYKRKDSSLTVLKKRIQRFPKKIKRLLNHFTYFNLKKRFTKPHNVLVITEHAKARYAERFMYNAYTPRAEAREAVVEHLVPLLKKGRIRHRKNMIYENKLNPYEVFVFDVRYDPKTHIKKHILVTCYKEKK